MHSGDESVKLHVLSTSKNNEPRMTWKRAVNYNIHKKSLAMYEY